MRRRELAEYERDLMSVARRQRAAPRADERGNGGGRGGEGRGAHLKSSLSSAKPAARASTAGFSVSGRRAPAMLRRANMAR